MPLVNCKLCNKETYKRPSSIKKSNNVFCSLNCLSKYSSIQGSEIKNCQLCSNKFKVIKANIKRRSNLFCSKGCYYEWLKKNKKTTIGKDGYEYYGKKRKHRIIMEEFIGRKLNKDEVIHHINGNKSDNRIDNLQLMTQSEHIRLHYNSGMKEILLKERSYINKCHICSKEFKSKSKKAMYCSPHCIYISRKDYFKKWKYEKK